MLFFMLSNTNVKVALLSCKEKEMTPNAKCFKQKFLKGKKYGKMQHKIKNIPVGGEISDLTVSAKKKGGGGGTICTVQYQYNKELRAELILHIFLLHRLPVLQNFSLLNLYLHNTSSQPNNKMWFGSQKNMFYLCTDSLKNDTITTRTHA